MIFSPLNALRVGFVHVVAHFVGLSVDTCLFLVARANENWLKHKFSRLHSTKKEKKKKNNQSMLDVM